MRAGYSFEAYTANVAEMQKVGHSRESSIWTAAALARKTYFKAHPGGALPVWLAYPKSCRLQQHYEADGTPSRSGAYIVHKNPLRAETVNATRARNLYKGFTGRSPKTLKRVRLAPLPETALAIGKVIGIIYQVDATGERLQHEFVGSARPLLLVSADGRQVFLHGGAYTFTKRGFVDKPNPRK